MIKLGIVLAAAIFAAGPALAETATTTTTTTTVAPVTAATVPVAATATTVTTVCPNIEATPPMPCAAKATMGITGRPVILVPGLQERFALDSLHVRDLNWFEAVMLQPSLASQTNPLMNSRPNWVLTRHGNPLYPYYGIKTSVSQVAGYRETFSQWPASVNAESQTVLNTMAARYRGLTPQQAMAMGYQPVGACLPTAGQVYINQAAIDNRFDAMAPEAFSIDRRGLLVAVHYLLLSDQPFMAFGLGFQPGTLVQGAQQLTVWQVAKRNGVFAAQNTVNYCR